uniref:Uncharacterized protein n=1 Tax=Arundo donax TaxID=35708 RepID=A0A0A8ZFU0_ARUDO
MIHSNIPKKVMPSHSLLLTLWLF